MFSKAFHAIICAVSLYCSQTLVNTKSQIAVKQCVFLLFTYTKLMYLAATGPELLHLLD